MADPTSIVNVNWSLYDGRTDALITTSEALVPGGYVGIDTTAGTMEFCADSADITPCGIVVGNTRGLNTLLTGDGASRAVSRGGIVLKEVAVTGASAITDVGDLVYASDGQTLTKTASNMNPFGRIVKWYSSTTCDVYVFTYEEA